MPRTTYSAIRHFDAPYDGPRIVAGDNANNVYVCQFKGRKRIMTFKALLDSLGSRLAINPRGDICAVGSDRFGGLTCYAADTGDVICVRDDLGRLHRVSYSHDGSRLYCYRNAGRLTVLDAETGEDVDRYPLISRLYGGPFQPIELLDKTSSKGQGDTGPVELRKVDGKRIASIVRETFAILDVAFGPDRLCITESGGPVRCLETEHGAEVWRYTPRPNRHILKLAYSPKAKAFFGIEWPYVSGGIKQLLRFDPEAGEPTLVTKIVRRSAYEVFCSRGDALLTSEGELIDVATGATQQVFRFPSLGEVSEG